MLLWDDIQGFLAVLDDNNKLIDSF
jgi:hypothetical protein